MPIRIQSLDLDPDPSPSLTQIGKYEEKKLFTATATPVYIVLPFSSVSKVVKLFVNLDSYLNFADNLVFSLR